MDVSLIYDELRRSEMNDWVGGSDPEAVGEACLDILKRHLTFGPSSRLLDFGCGVGRVMLAIVKRGPQAAGRLVGFDIMPQVVDFARQHIASVAPWTAFELIEGSNDHYDGFIRAAGAIARRSHADILAQYRGSFTGAYAFSVFTHLEESDFEVLLRFVGDLLVPGGEFLFTCFLLTPYSRDGIAQGTCMFPFERYTYEQGGDTFIGNTDDRLGFIAFELKKVEQMVFDAGLVITRLEHGAWTGCGVAATLQDVVACRKPLVRTGAVARVPTVARPPREA